MHEHPDIVLAAEKYVDVECGHAVGYAGTGCGAKRGGCRE
jgi:hypothetical protein